MAAILPRLTALQALGLEYPHPTPHTLPARASDPPSFGALPIHAQTQTQTQTLIHRSIQPPTYLSTHTCVRVCVTPSLPQFQRPWAGRGHLPGGGAASPPRPSRRHALVSLPPPPSPFPSPPPPYPFLARPSFAFMRRRPPLTRRRRSQIGLDAAAGAAVADALRGRELRALDIRRVSPPPFPFPFPFPLAADEGTGAGKTPSGTRSRRGCGPSGRSWARVSRRVRTSPDGRGWVSEAFEASLRRVRTLPAGRVSQPPRR